MHHNCHQRFLRYLTFFIFNSRRVLKIRNAGPKHNKTMAINTSVFVWLTLTEIISRLNILALLMMTAVICFQSLGVGRVRHWHMHSAAYCR